MLRQTSVCVVLDSSSAHFKESVINRTYQHTNATVHAIVVILEIRAVHVFCSPLTFDGLVVSGILFDFAFWFASVGNLIFGID